MTHDELLDRYAELTVRAGLNVAKGQEVLITAPIEAVPLVRRITVHAYKAGATLVTTLYNDEQNTLARYVHGADASFDTAPAWLFNGMAEAFRGGAARLGIIGEDPALLSGQDTEKVARANRARSTAYRPALELITGFAINWCIISCATPAWAKSVFPELPPAEGLAALWRAIFKCTRADLADPVGAWEAHSKALRARTDRLNARRYKALKYRGPGTDLTIGLVDNHIWCGGASTARNGIVCNPNIPSEEVFTMPHRERVDGTVSATKPLSYQGSFIEGIRVRFENGRIVEAHADKGLDVFRKMIETDEGAARLGEVALVPHSSPIAASGIIFNETLFDENAASHIAVGQAYSQNLRNAHEMSKEQKQAAGANSSLIHVDWMIGSGQIDIDGVTADGTAEPLMRQGEWAA
ncbi:MAG: aminopeptidase [Rhizobiales bacterium]|nr:aminopeptidase [Hyphomicrobiales bacterium]MBI3673498.1 aminopeptidase [Hyphomicrobiales bacterium]